MYPRAFPPVDESPSDPDPVIEAYKRDVDRSLIRENLRRTPEERLRDLMRLQRAGTELHRAMEAALRDRR